MLIYGSFQNHQSEIVSVYILTRQDSGPFMEIGTEAADVYFSDDPVEITSEVNDTFDVLLHQSATVKLLCGNLVDDFFNPSCRDAIVNIYKGDKCVFAGFIEPQTYSQPYNERWDEVELNCVDALSALQYSGYKNIGSAGVNYTYVKNTAGPRSFLDILSEIIKDLAMGIDIRGGQGIKLWYDGSKGTDPGISQECYKIFERLSISELLFLGGNESEVWRQDQVLEEILKYLNLHIVQEGLDFYIYSWESVKTGGDIISWKDLLSPATKETTKNKVDIRLNNVVGCDTAISIGEVYNQLMLTCKIESLEVIIGNPLEADDLTSPYDNKQKYMTEYSVDVKPDNWGDGDGGAAYWALRDLVQTGNTSHEGAKITDYYIRVLRNNSWRFPIKGDVTTDLIDHYCRDGRNQQALLTYLGDHLGACFLAWGKNERTNKDTGVESIINMENYMVISLGEHGVGMTEEDMPPGWEATNALPNTLPISALKEYRPLAVYDNNDTNTSLSPADNDTVHYIVLSGKIILSPERTKSRDYTLILNPPGVEGAARPWYSNGKEFGQQCTQQFWRAGTPNSAPEWDKENDIGLLPWRESASKMSIYCGENENGIDTIDKVDVLTCMLIVGDKCVVEIENTTLPGERYKNYVWREFKEREKCQNDDEYYAQSFSIAFNPVIGDCICGQEFDIIKTFSSDLGIDAEGIGIAIRKEDNIHGRIRFMIVSPVDTKLEKKLFKNSFNVPSDFKYLNREIQLVHGASSIMLKSFEIKVYSDNGKINLLGNDNDVAYISDTDETFINKKDDIEFAINTALSSAECKRLGVSNSVKMSTPTNSVTGEVIRSIYDRHENVIAKPEQLYIDRYYAEYHKPRVVMSQKLKDTDNIVSLFNLYTHNALRKQFYVQGLGRNLMEGSANLTLKEAGT